MAVESSFSKFHFILLTQSSLSFLDWLRLANLSSPYASTAERRRLLRAAKRHVARLSWQLEHLRQWQRRLSNVIARDRDVVCVHVDEPQFESRVHSSLWQLNSSNNDEFHGLLSSQIVPCAARLSLDQFGVRGDELPLWNALISFVYAGEWTNNTSVGLLDTVQLCIRLGFERLVAPLCAAVDLDTVVGAGVSVVAQVLPWWRICACRLDKVSCQKLSVRSIERLVGALDVGAVAALSDQNDVALMAELGAYVLVPHSTASIDGVEIDETAKHHVRRILLNWLSRAFGCRSTLAALKLCKQMASSTSVSEEKRHWSTLVTIVESNAVALGDILARAGAVVELGSISTLQLPTPPPPPLPVLPSSVGADDVGASTTVENDVAVGASRALKRAVLANLMRRVKRSRTNGTQADDDEDNDDDDDDDESDSNDDLVDDNADIRPEDGTTTTFLSSVLDFVTREILTSAAQSGRMVTPESIATVLNCDADLQALATNVMRKPSSAATTPSKPT
jgi:hypothetical protein